MPILNQSSLVEGILKKNFFEKKGSRRFVFLIALIIVVIIYSALIVIGTVLLQEPTKFFISKIFNKEKISWEVVFCSKFKKNELQKFVKKEKLDPFNLNLDDPLLNDYYITKLKVVNKGICIKGSLRFHVSIGEKYVKILDIKHRVNKPANKILTFSHSLPNLIWSIKHPNRKISFELESDRISKQRFNKVNRIKKETKYTVSRFLGFNVYRSIFKDVGFGRINEKIISQNTHEISFSEGYKDFYYALQPVISDDLMIELEKITKLKEFCAFQPFFKDITWIDFDSKSEKFIDYNDYEESMHNSMLKEDNRSIFIVNEYKDKISLQNSRYLDEKGKNILYLDDLRFLEGKAEIIIDSGISEGAEIAFFLLYKILPGEKHDVKLMLRDKPEIKLESKKPNIAKNFDQIAKDENQESSTDVFDREKLSLTPPKATFFPGKNTIFLVWEYPKDPNYGGVRIFRKIKKSNEENKNFEVEGMNDGAGNTSDFSDNAFGVPIYDEHGDVSNLLCNFCESFEDYNKSNREYTENEPPPRKGEIGVPVLRIASISEKAQANKKGLRNLPFFTDRDVRPDLIYEYTIFVYAKNKKNFYSFPIKITASLSDLSTSFSSSGLNCGVDRSS